MEEARALIPLVVVAGPTASGKTRLGVELALRYGGEVVSADSMQIYRGMDIGTAKPAAAEMCGVPHHMIDIVQPWESFSVAQYVARAKAVVADIHARGRLPVVVGGTGLYISSLTGNLDFMEAARDDKLREELRAEAEAVGGQALLDRLSVFDPETASQLHRNNLGRIIRAIEVYSVSGITMAEFKKRSRMLPPAYDCCKLGLAFADRSPLYERIDARVDAMLGAGLQAEVEGLLKTEGVMGSTAMQAIGYKELAVYINGAIGYEEAVELIKRGTRRYAKRQMTWFRRDEGMHWIDAAGDYENICKQACLIIDKYPLL